MIDLKDQDGRIYKVKCIEVPFLTLVQEQPNLSKIQELFPSIPVGSLNMPNMEVGILLGQNSNFLLPTGGTGEHKVDGLRIRRTVLGEYGYVLDGYHPEIWRPAVTNVEAWSKAVGILLCHRWNLVGDTFTFLTRTFLPEVFLKKRTLMRRSSGLKLPFCSQLH